MLEMEESKEDITQMLEKLEIRKAFGPDGLLRHILQKWRQQFSGPHLVLLEHHISVEYGIAQAGNMMMMPLTLDGSIIQLNQPSAQHESSYFE